MAPGPRGVLVLTAALATTTFAGFVCETLGLDTLWPGMLVTFVAGLIVFGLMTGEK